MIRRVKNPARNSRVNSRNARKNRTRSAFGNQLLWNKRAPNPANASPAAQKLPPEAKTVLH